MILYNAMPTKCFFKSLFYNNSLLNVFDKKNHNHSFFDVGVKLSFFLSVSDAWLLFYLFLDQSCLQIGLSLTALHLSLMQETCPPASGLAFPRLLAVQTTHIVITMQLVKRKFKSQHTHKAWNLILASHAPRG